MSSVLFELTHNITATSPLRPASVASHGDSHASRSRAQKTIAPNVPLKPLDVNRRAKLPDPLTIPTSTSSENPGTTPWTRAKLERERTDWWATRETGSPDVWAAYKQMVEHLQREEVQQAQVLLDAIGCTCPTGKLWHGIFDERGDQYSIHDARHNFEWIVFEPKGLVESAAGAAPGGGLDGQEEDLLSDKGKGKRRAEEVIPVKCRLSTTGQDHVIEMSKDEKIGSLIKRLSYITGLEPRRHRISYLGRILQPGEVLPTEGPRAWKPGNVLGVLVLNEA
ncbi:hypothetical protein K491DRAFT_715299 [Lophiostoma macrostomum CBS 122681]|uniref:DC-UbP/UBTD2 N-terminal domain-containing protein n=1 Tax=Lophiostoma macrostomum CBS 122681 TaxID=1314788 RepID=A0A6A6T9Q4_9PLEO|nr:hypothetical protein K491DRAFT_715299 [Lophiostoma macrostomum CBS 122681]